MKITEHLDGYRASVAVGRAMDPSLPRLQQSGLANLWAFRANALELLGRGAAIADITRVDLAYKPSLVVKHPDMVQAILEQPDVWLRGDGLVPLMGRNVLTTNGDEWLFNRQMIQPSFHPQLTGAASHRFARDAAGAMDAWGEFAASGQPMDVAWHAVRVFARWATPLMGFQMTDAEADRFPDALLRLQRWAFKVVAGGAFGSRQATADVALLDGVIARALAAPTPTDGPPSYVERLRQDHAIDRAKLRDHLMLALFASADNPPNAFAYTMWLLAHNPAHQEAARAEVAAVLGREVPTAEALDRMPLLERTVQEAMRLLPPVWILARFSVADTNLGGYHIPAGTAVFPPPYFVHRHPSAWDDPEAFRPDRFLPAAVEKRSRYAFIPFGSGPRMCVGARLATLEVRTLLALFLQRFRAVPASDAPLDLEGYFALRARSGVPIRITTLEP